VRTGVGNRDSPRGSQRRAKSDDINIHKVSDEQERRAEHIGDKLENKGKGRHQAEKEGMRQAVEELGYSAGGSRAAGDRPNHANHERDHRLGSDKKAHSGQS